MVIVAAKADVERLTTTLVTQGETVFRIGSIRERRDAEAQTIVV